MLPASSFATTAIITDAVPRAMMRAYERMLLSVERNSIGAMIPSARMSTGKSTSSPTTAGVMRPCGSTSSAASSTTMISSTITSEAPLPTACRG